MSDLHVLHTTKNKQLQLRVTPEELEQYKQLAMRAGYVSVSDLMRAGVVLVEERLQALGK